jgi:NAD(P)-dependent dehydrogenase (short-subunit alcohol dehydrogenase family)
VESRIAVVTGANRGIGLEVVRQLADAGYRVALCSRSLERGRAAAKTVDSKSVTAFQLDVADPRSVAALPDALEAAFEHIDVLVNNAAIDYDTDARAVSADLDRVRRAFDTNFFGAWAVCKALLPLLHRSRHPRIVNVSSEGGSVSEMFGGTPAYSTSKAALNALTRLLAGELQRERFLVNAVCPGWTDTDMGQGGRPVAEGAASVVWAALLPDDGPTGGFFRDGRPLPW